MYYIVSIVLMLIPLAYYLCSDSSPRNSTTNLAYKQYKMPDLRVSDDAPDWYSAKVAKNEYDSMEPYRHRVEMNDLYREMHLEQARAIQELKIRRWKEGRPVTKEDPL